MGRPKGASQLSAAEKQRRYRARRDANPERRERYLKKEQQKYREDIASGRKKTVNNISKKEKCKRRKKWRETYHRVKSRKEALKHLTTPPGSPQWIFFEVSHGKGTPNGVGGALKRMADGLVSEGTDIPDASELFPVLNKTDTTIKSCFVEEEAADRAVSEMPKDVPPVPSTMAGRTARKVKGYLNPCVARLEDFTKIDMGVHSFPDFKAP